MVGPTRRAMALDLGTRRVGVAVTDRGGALAFPWGILERSGDPGADRARILALAQELEVTTIVVGLPLRLDGSAGPAATAAAREAELLGAGAPEELTVTTFDERLTTVSAAASLAQAGHRTRAARHRVDAAAATVILQGWLDRQPSRPRSGDPVNPDPVNPDPVNPDSVAP